MLKGEFLVAQEQIEQLFAAISEADSVLILPHNDPDPDAIASAVALRYLLEEKLRVDAQIAYRGFIGRAENKAMVRYLGRPLRRLNKADLRSGRPIALVDTQPGAGNNPLPSQISPAIVIDHHPWCDATYEADFFDVRPEMGATSTILTEYLRAASLDPPAPLSTALFYGIKTDTLGLSRGACPADGEAFCYLHPRLDLEALLRIEQAQIPAEYFKHFAATLQAAQVYDSVVISYIGPMGYPDQAAEMADLLLRVRGIRWVICIGTYKEHLILSVRTQNKRGAGQLVQKIVGDQGTAGGHGSMAGARVLLNHADPDQLARRFSRQALAHLGVPTESGGKPLI